MATKSIRPIDSKAEKLLCALEYVSPHVLRPHPGNARTHNRRQRRALKASIRRFGFRQPILARKDGQIVAGHERVEASKELSLKEIPVIWIENLSEDEIRAYVIADNKIAQLAGWDKELLATELQFLVEVGFDLEPIGFEAPEVDLLIESVGELACTRFG